MKRSILLATLGLTVSAIPSFSFGIIALDNYNSFLGSGGPPVTSTYHNGANGPGLGSGWTAGFYYALGDVTGSIYPDPTGLGDPTTLGGGLTLATGLGSTAAFYTSTFNTPGEFLARHAFGVPGTANAGGDTITLMLVAYNGFSYNTSTYRGHSDAFTMPTSPLTDPHVLTVGDYMPVFTVLVPEPATLALGSLGLTALLLVRCKRI